MKKDVREDYFLWLCDKVGADRDHSLLMRTLHDVEFTWTIANDDNRAMDGMVLRDKYAFEKGLEEYDALRVPCTMLEMMVGLAVRCENDIMLQSSEEDRTSLWFWSMVNNLGLLCEETTDELFDEDYVRIRVDRVLKRRYSRNGSGGLFPLKHPKKDQRKVEIWYQMSFWLQECYPIEEIFSEV